MIRTKLMFVAAVALLSGCGARAAQRDDAAPAGRQTLRHGGIDRTYIVRTPARVTAGQRVPLVIVFHGGGGNALNAETMTGFTAKGSAEGFIVVYPDGTGRLRNSLLTWNAGHCCGYAMENRVDDTGFVNALIDKLSAQYSIDSKRIYATGMSNGAMVSHRVGIELSDRIAAIAPVVGTVFGDEARPRNAVSALMINGLLDKNVPNAGGPTGGRPEAWDGTPTRPALEQATFWAAANGCAPTPRPQDQAAYIRYSHDCAAGTAVELYIVKDNGHAWPGGRSGSRLGDTPSTSLDATDVIWRFFAAHPKK